MKIIRKIILVLLLLIVLLGTGIYVYLQGLKPQYSGNISLKGLLEEVEIFFDEYGIPHIYAQNEEDVYFALGYVHAQERLFQMEMMRRVGGGRLAEILGEDLVKTDLFFRTLGIERVAEQSVAKYLNDNTQPYQKAALAYLKGINQYIEKGKTPIEYTILNIPKEKFTPKDIYLIMGYMAFNFAHGFRTDPIVTQVQQQYGTEYLKDLAVHWVPGDEKIPIYKSGTTYSPEKIAFAVSKIVDNLPVAVWLGSNGWVVGPKKTESGKVIFANDTHIGYSQPSVWYEAHLECPGFSFYGNHLAGFPFGLVGNNRFSAWGLTMFENDDVDFYWEKANPENLNQVWVNDHWEDMQSIEEIIKVKGGEDVIFQVQISRHGPIINEAMEPVAQLDTVPVAVWWAYTKFQSRTMQASYLLSHAKSMDDFRKAAFMIDAPGLNVMYGDRDGNIAWWAIGKLVKRPPHVNSKIFLDGASGKDEPLGYYDFSENPQSENPPSGFVYSANNQPDSIAGVLYPGYYTPEHRAKRIVKYLQSDKKWTVEEMKKMLADVTTADYPLIAKEIINTINKDDVINTSSNHQEAIQILEDWNGEHQMDDVAPTIYYKLLYNILEMTLSDELGDESFRTFLTTHLMKRTVPVLIKNDSSLWWDNILTQDIKETRKTIFVDAFDLTIRDLEIQLGTVISEWSWGRVHTLEHVHPIGSKKPFDRVFNVGPFPVKGGNEVINNLGFTMNKEGQYKVSFGPAMRILLDFADLENSVSINPTGQSGYFLSDHYDDQAEMYNSGTYRKQMMNREEIEAKQKGKLILQPE